MHPIFGALAFYIVLCILVGLAADRTMYRSLLGWTLLAFLFSPLAAFVFLQVAGPPLRAADRVRKAQETLRQRMTVDEESHAEYACPSCGNPINLATRQGISSPTDEPWRIACTSCEQEINADQI